MKKRNLALVFALLGEFFAQAQPPPVPNLPPPPSIAYQVVSNGPDQQVYQALSLITNSDGHVSRRIHSYEKVATGLNHLENGQWVPSIEQVAIQPDGSGAATNGQHQAFYPVDIYDGNIQLVMPGGQQLQSQPLALSYDDGSNLAVIAVLTNAVGCLEDDNKVVYTNAFCGLNADILYTYRNSGFEQDIILRQRPPDPATLGLNPETTRLQVLTEFINSPTPVVSATTLRTQAGYAIQDEELDFGSMKMVPGKAFLIGDETNADGSFVPVCKQWQQVNGRQFLVEEIPLTALADELSTLPLFAMSESKSYRHIASNQRLWPVGHMAKSSGTRRQIRTSGRKNADQGLVLDYNLVLNGATDFTFRGDTTYYVSGTLSLWGTTVIEGGTVIKFDPTNSAESLGMYGPVKCLTGPYRKATLTIRDDNSVGETIIGSTGNPTTSLNAYGLGYGYDSAPFYFHDLQVRYLFTGVMDGTIAKTRAWTNVVRNCEFYSVYRAFIGNPGYFGATNRVDVQNTLIENGDAAFQEWNSETFSAENVTIQNEQFILRADGTPATLFLTNCLIVGLTNWVYSIASNLVINADHSAIIQCPAPNDPGCCYNGSPCINLRSCLTNSSAVGVFQSAGAGSFYLATNSPCRAAGTADIDPVLLAALNQKTTWPPMIYSNSTVTVPTTFNVPVPRDTNTNPDIGFHYDPIDVLFAQFYVNGTAMAVSNGIVVSTYGTNGLLLVNGGQLLSSGTPLSPNLFVNAAAVQETPFQGSNCIVADTTGAAAGEFRFTKFYCPAGCGFDLYDNANSVFGTMDVRNCEFWGGANDLTGGNTNGSAILVNNLFWRSSLYASNSLALASLNLTNNLFWGTTITLQQPSGVTWNAFNNNFDSSIVTGTLTNGFNAYLGSSGRLSPQGANDYISTNDGMYESGSLGDFYLPPNSPLANAGNTTADLVGLYQFTTQTNQAKEGDTIVDVGYHYVAVNTNGYPMASSGDGIPDYVEDPNGLTNWFSAPSIVTESASRSADLGDDVFFTVVAAGYPLPLYQWYFNGTPLTGATNATLEVDNVHTSNVGNYYVNVSNVYGSATSVAVSLTAVYVSPYYTVVQGGLTNFVFQGDTTYFVNSTVELFGTTTIEGGSVIKYANHSWAQLVFNGPLTCKTAMYRPALCTSKDDDSMGSLINYSSGSPTNDCQTTCLVDGSGLISYYGNFHFKYAGTAISGGTHFDVWDSQFVQCGTAIGGSGGIGLHNVLMSLVTNCISTSSNVMAEFVTADQCFNFCSGSSGSASLTNCILTAISNTNHLNLTDSVILSDGAGVYQVAGGGNYYLGANIYQGQGAANASPAALADIAVKTTCPPQFYGSTNVFFSTSLNLYPQAFRDTNSNPTLGYHYDPIDYDIGGIYVVNATISVNAGTTLSIHGTREYDNNAVAIAIADQASFLCSGLANSLVHIVPYNAVQEQNVPDWGRPWYGGIAQFSGANNNIGATFTDWSSMAQDFAMIQAAQTGPINFQNCQFHGGYVLSYNPTLNFTNCLFERVYCDIEPFDGNTPVFRNNTVYGGTFGYSPYNPPTNAIISDNLFDHTTIPDWLGGFGLNYVGGNNAYVTNCDTLDPTFPSDMILNASPAYQTSCFGAYYLPPASPLINAGSETADQVGLYHFTTQTNQQDETNSIVDIGYHYVASDLYGNPLDNNGDGIPDYIQDGNGNGQVDVGEYPWIAPPIIIIQPTNQIVGVADTASFGVVAVGAEPITYQWLLNGIPISGATNNTYSKSNVQSSDNDGVYTVEVGNPAGLTCSSQALLIVWLTPVGLEAWWQAESNTLDSTGLNPPGIVEGDVGYGTGIAGLGFSFAGLSDVHVAAGSSLDVGGNGNGFTIEGWIYPLITNATYSIFESDAGGTNNPVAGLMGSVNAGGDLYGYLVDAAGGWHEISSAGGVITSNAFYHVALTYDPSSGLVNLYCNGTIVVSQQVGSFATEACHDFYMGYSASWGFDYIGTIDESSVYDHALTSGEIAAIYYYGSKGKKPIAPSISSQPASQTVSAGTDVTFSVTATGSPPLAYQWLLNGSSISGATGSTYTKFNAQSSDSGEVFSVQVQNSAGVVTSGGATLTVASPPVITQAPFNVNAVAGSSVSFSVSATGPSLTYQWMYNGTPLSGKTSSSLTLFNVQTSVAGQYSVSVANSGGVVSKTANLLVLQITELTSSYQFTLAGALAGSQYDLYVKPTLTSGVNYRIFYCGSPGQTTMLTPKCSSPYGFLQAGSAADTDGDGLKDGYEGLVSFSDRTKVDTDGDGMPDAWEVEWGTNPNANDASSNPDGDSLSNLQEYNNGTDPFKNNSTAPRPVVTVSTGSGAFVIGRTGSTSSSLVVNYTVGGTAVYGQDYTLSPAPSSSTYPFSVTIPAGSSSITITPSSLPVGKTVMLALIPFSFSDYPDPSTWTYVVSPIADRATAAVNSVITIAATTPRASEFGLVNGQFTVTRTGGNQTGSLVVNLQTSTGSAISGTDYSALPSSVTIPAGTGSTTITVTPVLNPNGGPNNKTLILQLASSANYTVGSPGQAMCTIVPEYGDSDGDGLADIMESFFGGTPQTLNPGWNTEDTANDGIPASYQSQFGDPSPATLPTYNTCPLP